MVTLTGLWGEGLGGAQQSSLLLLLLRTASPGRPPLGMSQGDAHSLSALQSTLHTVYLPQETQGCLPL